MKPDHRSLTLLALLAVLLLVFTAWNYSRLADHRSMAFAAVEETRDCHRLAAQINSLQSQPAQAGSAELQVTELTRGIEQSANQAQIQLDHLIRIWPQPAARINDSPYKAKSTQVLLKGVSLPQVVRFLHALETQDAGPRTTRLRLKAPDNQDAVGTWTVEATLTHVIYAPNPQPQRSPEVQG